MRIGVLQGSKRHAGAIGAVGCCRPERRVAARAEPRHTRFWIRGLRFQPVFQVAGGDERADVRTRVGGVVVPHARDTQELVISTQNARGGERVRLRGDVEGHGDRCADQADGGERVRQPELDLRGATMHAAVGARKQGQRCDPRERDGTQQPREPREEPFGQDEGGEHDEQDDRECDRRHPECPGVAADILDAHAQRIRIEVIPRETQRDVPGPRRRSHESKPLVPERDVGTVDPHHGAAGAAAEDPVAGPPPGETIREVDDPDDGYEREHSDLQPRGPAGTTGTGRSVRDGVPSVETNFFKPPTSATTPKTSSFQIFFKNPVFTAVAPTPPAISAVRP